MGGIPREKEILPQKVEAANGYEIRLCEGGGLTGIWAGGILQTSRGEDCILLRTVSALYYWRFFFHLPPSAYQHT